MATIPWLAAELRRAGLTVVEHAGWQTRAVSGSWSPTFGIVHATAAPRSQADETQVRIVRDGREGLQGPIANACVDRAGRWHVLAAGRCNTTIAGTAGPYAGQGNIYALGVEACNDNVSEPWPDVQYRAYVRGWAAIARRMGWEPARLRGHKEHTPGHKTDPTFSMATFRRDVAAVLAGEDDDMAAIDYIDGRTEAEAYGRTEIRDGYPNAGEPAWVVTALKLLDAKVTALAGAVAAGNAADAQRDAELRALFEAHSDGQLDAEAVVRRMGELLTAVAPQE